MVLCKFFLQGMCRFGENCKFEHQYTEKPHNTSFIRQQSFNPNNESATGTSIDTAQLIRSVVNDMNALENGGQWLFSCFAPFKEKSLFPGFEDHSFEEIRFGYYTSKANGTLDAYLQQLNGLLQEAMMRVKSLQNPTQEAVTMLRAIYDEQPAKPAANAFTNQSPMFPNTQNTVFANAQTNKSIFASVSNPSSTSVFNSSSQQQKTAQSIFAEASKSFTASQKSIFSGGNQGTFIPAASSPFAYHQAQTYVKENAFSNSPFSTNTNPSPFSSAIQNKPFVTPLGQSGPSIFNSQPTSSSSNSPLISQQNVNSTYNPPQVQQTSIFSNSVNPFGNVQQQPQVAAAVPPSIPQPANIFSSNTAQSNLSVQPAIAIDDTLYSKPEELSESDIKSYQAENFEFGKVPEKPPHISMC